MRNREREPKKVHVFVENTFVLPAIERLYVCVACIYGIGFTFLKNGRMNGQASVQIP